MHKPNMEATHMTNPLATVDQLYRRASYSAMPTDLQDLVFFATQRLTQAAGILLRLPQSVTAQANVLLARYWLVESPLADEFSVSLSPVHTPYLSFPGFRLSRNKTKQNLLYDVTS